MAPSFFLPVWLDTHEHSDTSRDMAVFLANGVTTVLNMGEARNSFMAQTRPKVNSGEIPGPHIYAGFLVDGSPEFGHLAVTTSWRRHERLLASRKRTGTISSRFTITYRLSVSWHLSSKARSTICR